MIRQRIFWVLSLLLLMLFSTSCEEIERIVYETFNSEEYDTGFRYDSHEMRKRQEVKADEVEQELLEEFRNDIEKQLLAHGEYTERVKALLLEEYRGRSGFGYELQRYVERVIEEAEIDEEMAVMIREHFDATTNSVQNPFIPLFFQKEQLREIKRDLYTFLGASELYLYDNIYFTDNRIWLSVQNPANSEEVDTYEYWLSKGTWEYDKAVRLSARDIAEMEKKLYPLDNIDWGIVYDVYQVALDKLGEINGIKLPNMVYFFLFKERFTVSVENERSRHSMDFDLEGQMTSYKMD